MKKTTKTLTEEEYELYMQDMCSRVLSNPVVYNPVTNRNEVLEEVSVWDGGCTVNGQNAIVYPYLKHLKDMTDEEIKDLGEHHEADERFLLDMLKQKKEGKPFLQGRWIPWHGSDWCNRNHYDYRGMIEAGLAIEVTEENNPYKE